MKKFIQVDPIFEKVGVVLAAGGVGRRFGQSKLWVEVANKPLFMHSLDAFLSLIPPSQLVMVVPEQDCTDYRELLSQYHPGILFNIVAGGKERALSVLNGLQALPEGLQYVIVHDAARPLVTPSLICSCVKKSIEKKAGVIAVSPVTDTIKRVSWPSENVLETLSRNELVAVQTPQVFPLSLLKNAYEKIVNAGERLPTDDAGAFESVGGTVLTFLHESPNLKLTYPHDLPLIETLLLERLDNES